MKRLFSQRTFTLHRLEQVLTALELDFFELAKLARGAGDAPEEMTETQAHALAAEPRLMGVFYLLFNDWQPAQILARYELTEPELTKLLVKLDRLQLIELLPSNKVKVRVGRHLRLRPSGAIRAKHGQRTMAEFLAASSIAMAEIFVSSSVTFRQLRSRSFTASSTGWLRSSTNWRNSTARYRRISGSRSASCWACGRGKSGRSRT